MQFEEGLDNPGDIYTAVLRRAMAVREINGSEGELVAQLTLTLDRYEGLVAHFARTKDSIVIGVTRRLP